MDYGAIFLKARRFLEERSCLVTQQSFPVVESNALEKLHNRTGVLLPQDMVRFYKDFSDGFRFAWENGPSSGELELFRLKEIEDNRISWVSHINSFINQPNSMDCCVEPEHRRKAFAVWKQMLDWVPISIFGQGDSFCLDQPSGEIFYSAHDWFDGFGQIEYGHGLLMAESFGAFVKEWSIHTFQQPLSGWWGEFGPGGRVDWNSDRFDAHFVQPV